MVRRVAAVMVPGLVCALVLAGASHAQKTDDAAALNADVMRLYHAGKYPEATEIAKRVLAIYEKALGPEHTYVGTSLNNLALMYQAQGRYAEAEPLLQRSLAIREKALGPEHPDVGQSLNNLASLYQAQGRYADAEPLLRRTVAIFEKALGPEHPDLGTSLNNLASLYHHQGRYAEAEPLFRRDLTIAEKTLGPEHPHVGTALNNLAELYQAQGRYAEAEPLLQRCLAIREKALGPEHPYVGTSRSNLALLYEAQGRYAEAQPLLQRSLAIAEKTLGPEHPDVGTFLNNLALLYEAQGRYAEAEPLYRRDLTIREKALGPEHPSVGASLNNLAWLALTQGDWAQAADYWRRSTGVIQRRAQRGLASTAEGSSKREAQRLGWESAGLVKVTHHLATQGRVELEAQARAMFETAQWAHGSEAATSLAQMAARSAKGSPELAGVVRERQDLVSEWQAKDKQLIAARSEPPARRDATTEMALGDRLAAIDVRLAAIDAGLAKDFPDYAALASPAPVSVAEVQAQFGADEALVLFFDTPQLRTRQSTALPEETFIWVVTKSDVRWVRSELGTEALAREVAALRCGLDASNWTDAGGWPEEDAIEQLRKKDQIARRNRCKELTGADVSDTDAPPFDPVRAHALHKGLFGEVADLIKGKHLIIVPSGALTQLPFQVLVTEYPAGSAPNLREVAWFARSHAITVLPAASSLKALRRNAKPSAAPEPFLGYGDPVLTGNIDCETVIVPNKCPDQEHSQASPSPRGALACRRSPPAIFAATRPTWRR